jgi:hypothetical protein
MWVALLGVRLLDGFRTTADNAHGRLGPLIEEAGFEASKRPRGR